MHIFVKSLNCRTIALDVQYTDSVSDNVAAISARTGAPPCQLRIILAGKQLEEGRTLFANGVQKEFTLHLRHVCVAALRFNITV